MKEYTKTRRVYAIIGFVTTVSVVIYVLYHLIVLQVSCFKILLAI